MKTLVLFDNSNYDNYDYDAYLEYCHEMDETPGEVDSQEYIEWERDTENTDWCNALNDFKEKELVDYDVLVTGTLGLWDGKHKIEPKIFRDFDEAISAMCQDSIEVKISQIDEFTWKLENWHHDGKNEFIFRFLAYPFDDTDEIDWDDLDNFVEGKDDFEY